MPLHHPTLVKQPDQFDPAQFFDEVVASALNSRRNVAAHFGGSCCVELFGSESARWRIDLGGATVTRGDETPADLMLRVEGKWLELLITGKKTIEQAISAGALRAEGDPDMFDKLSIILRP